MRKTTFLLIIIASLFLTASRPDIRPVFTSGNYRIYILEKSDKGVEYKVNDFYSVYYVYMNVIRALDVNMRLGERDIEKVISLIIDNLKKRNVVQLQVDNYRGPGGALSVTLRQDIAPEGNKPILLVVSNYNAKTKRVVEGDDQKDAYATLYFFAGDKLVKNRYVFEAKSEAELKKGPVNNRADYYLLDGDPRNDALGKDLLTKEIEKPGDAPDRAVLYMTLSEYHLLAGNVGSAKQCLDKARTVIKSVKDDKARRTLANVQRYADDLYEYYVKYTGLR